MARDNRALSNVLEDINKLERTEIEQSGKIIYEEFFFKYLLLGVLLFAASEAIRKIIMREGV
jgi:Ca-activated chloride channel family protein